MSDRQKDHDNAVVLAAKIADLYKVDPLIRDVRLAADKILALSRETGDEQWDAAIEACAKLLQNYVEAWADAAEHNTVVSAQRRVIETHMDAIRKLKRGK